MGSCVKVSSSNGSIDDEGGKEGGVSRSRKNGAGGAVVCVTKPSKASSKNGYGGPGTSRGSAISSVKRFRPNVACKPSTTQQQVFEMSKLKSLIDHSMKGYRATIFAYGQTGAGKTHTVIGDRARPGLIYRGVHYLFQQCALAKQSGCTFTVRLSAIELYNEQCEGLQRLQLRHER